MRERNAGARVSDERDILWIVGDFYGHRRALLRVTPIIFRRDSDLPFEDDPSRIPLFNRKLCRR